ncbi:E3 ubiquitin-protein ligase TRIM41-like [Latimeria chalumnae]|uniref:E3 ubiquitin-protein ligase TRIM41-like n=1 Tax=Latimeria chalumnae TaxID=7897 RepID=UPI00313AB743
MASQVQTLGAELYCSICLDLYKDPVILECSHNFCRACISQVWDKAAGRLSCPECRQVFHNWNMKPNRTLTNIVQKYKNIDLEEQQHQASRERDEVKEKGFYCEEHEEKLKLFCEEDQEMICVVCGMSQSHKSHNLLPIKEAFHIYKVQKN